MNNSGIIITLAYPETIVRVSDEWFIPFLRYFGIGTKDFVRAGHAAFVLIDKATGILEYHDFGRYIIPRPHGRVRNKVTDHELDFPLKAEIKDNEIRNLNEILEFLATNPKLTHGEGKMIASVCDAINYDNAKTYIASLQEPYFINYAVFKKDASNCSRFVTTTLIASTTNPKIKRKLIWSTRFTPSTVGNVVKSDTKNMVYEVSDKGVISEFKSTIAKENIKYFLDSLKGFSPNTIGNLEPKKVEGICDKAQWLSGIGSGAWFELQPTNQNSVFRFRRVSPYGNVDVHDVFHVNEASFDYNQSFNFLHHSNCSVLHIMQNETIYKFEKRKAN